MCERRIYRIVMCLEDGMSGDPYSVRGDQKLELMLEHGRLYLDVESIGS